MAEGIENKIIKKAGKLFDGIERANARDQWDLLAEFIMNNQWANFVGETTKGEKKTRRVYDGTAPQANNDLAANIHATLTNPATKWSTLAYKNKALNDDQEASAWLSQVNQRIHEELNESNFDSMQSKNYQGFTCLGSMVLMAEEKNPEDPGFDGFLFNAWHMSEVAFQENHEGLVDTIYRKFKWPIHKIISRFPDTAPDRMKKKVDRSPDEEEEIIFCIAPRDPKELDPNGLPTPQNRPYSGHYVLKKGSVLLEETGFHELPFFAVRWSTLPGEVYGRGPGHLALPDVRSINRSKQLNLQMFAKNLNPPILASERDVLGNFDMRPGRMTLVRDINGIKEMVPTARGDLTQFNIQELKDSIRASFFIDKLMLPPRTETGEQTAFEVAQRLEQMQRVLGPQLSRLNSEFLAPLIVRLFKILLRSGELPEPPAILQETGLDIDIKFVNPLARALELEDVNNALAWMQQLSIAAQVTGKPEVMDWVNTDFFADMSHDSRGIVPEMMTSAKAVQALRKQRAQAAQAQQQLEAGVQLADIASKTGGQGGQQQ